MDSSLNPADQASFNKLIAALEGKTAEFDQIIAAARQEVEQFGTVSRESIAQQQAQARKLSASKPAQTGPGTVRETTASVEQLVAAETQVNKLLTQQIELRTRAAAAAREQLTAVRGQTAGGVLLPNPAPAPSSTPTPVPTGGGGAQGAAKVKQQAAADAKAAENARLLGRAQIGAAEGTALSTMSTERNVLAMSQANNVLQRHGALTTEFITAAGRGQVTLREFGDQIGQTAAKFGGWTLAAAGVYGVIGAVAEFARGAIDATDAAQNLSRTIETGFSRTAATQGVVQLAHDTNTSMKEAGDAAFLFSRTFHSVADATYVAGLALRAYKLDGVSVTDQVKAMTAIHQQFKITAQGMGPVWGLLANGQREFNARVNEMVPAMIGSMTAVKNAGGDLTDYIKILQIALRTTQLTGPQLATAFRRAPTFLNRPTSQNALRSLGFDPEEAINHFTDFFQKVLKRAPQMSGADRRTLFQGIFGPQFGQRMAGLSTVDPKLMQQIMGQNVTSASPLLQEFSKLLGTPTQQLEAIRNNVQQLGAELGQSGLLAPLGLFVKGLNAGLNLTTQLLRLWSQLPGPVKQAGGYLAAFAGTRALLGRMNVGIPLLGPSQNKMVGRQISTGLQAEQDFYQQSYSGALRNAATNSLAVQAAARQRNVAVQNGDQEEIIAQERRLEMLMQKQSDLEAEAAALQTQTVEVAARRNAFMARTASGMGAESAALASGINYRLSTLERGVATTSPVSTIPGSAAARLEQSAGGVVLPYGVSAPPSQVVQPLGRIARARQMLTEQLAMENKAMQEATAAGDAAAPTLGRSVAANQAMAAGAMSTRERLSGLVPSLGGMVMGIFAIGIIAEGISDSLHQLDQAEQSAIDAIAQVPHSEKAAQDQAAQLKGAASKVFNNTKGAQGLWGEIVAGVHGVPILGPVATAGGAAIASAAGINPNAMNSTGATGEAAQLAQQFWGAMQTRRQAQIIGSHANAWGAQVPTVSYHNVSDGGEYTMMIAQAKGDAQRMSKTQAGREEWAQQLRMLTQAGRDSEQHALSLATSDESRAAIRGFFQGYTDELHSIDKAFQDGLKILSAATPKAEWKVLTDMSPTAIVSSMQGLADRMKIYGTDKGSMQKLAMAFESLAVRNATSSDPQALAQVITAQGLFVDTVQQSANDLITEAQNSSKSQARGLYSQARGEVNAAIGYLRSASVVAHHAVLAKKAAYEASFAALQELDRFIAQAGNSTVQMVLTWVLNERGMAKIVANNVNALAAASKAANTANKANNKIIAQLQGELKAINSAQNTQLKTPKTPSSPASEDPYNLARLRSEIAQAQAEGDPVKQAQIAKQFAAIELHGARNENERLQAQLDMIQAENQYWQAVEQRTQSYYTYLESTTTDPLKIARYQKKAADDAVRSALEHGGKGTQTYFEAKAKQNQAGQNLVQQQIQQREDSIDFNLTMQRISTQTAIQEYRALLNVHGITKQLRRQVLEKIKQLKDAGQSEFGALDLGTIRLPTPYEIRRAVMGLRQQAMSNVTNHYNTTINADGPAGATAVGVVMDRYHSGTGKAISRATGTR